MKIILVSYNTDLTAFGEIIDYLQDNKIPFGVGNTLQIDFENEADAIIFNLKFIYEYGKEDEV